MIPNFAPMAAVYLRHDATGSRGGKLFSRPVAAWDRGNYNEALIPNEQGKLTQASNTIAGVQFLGLWHRGWSPSYHEMASLLPEHTPGTPRPLTIGVTIWPIPGGWAARHTADELKTVVEAVTPDSLRAKLDALGNYCVDRVVLPEE